MLKLWRSKEAPNEHPQECAFDAARSRACCPSGAERADAGGRRLCRRRLPADDPQVGCAVQGAGSRWSSRSLFAPPSLTQPNRCAGERCATTAGRRLEASIDSRIPRAWPYRTGTRLIGPRRCAPSTVELERSRTCTGRGGTRSPPATGSIAVCDGSNERHVGGGRSRPGSTASLRSPSWLLRRVHTSVLEPFELVRRSPFNSRRSRRHRLPSYGPWSAGDEATAGGQGYPDRLIVGNEWLGPGNDLKANALKPVPQGIRLSAG